MYRQPRPSVPKHATLARYDNLGVDAWRLHDAPTELAWTQQDSHTPFLLRIMLAETPEETSVHLAVQP